MNNNGPPPGLHNGGDTHFYDDLNAFYGKGKGKNKGKGKGCFNCGSTEHIARDCPKPVTCHNCGEEGHYAANCPKGKGKKGKGKGQYYNNYKGKGNYYNSYNKGKGKGQYSVNDWDEQGPTWGPAPVNTQTWGQGTHTDKMWGQASYINHVDNQADARLLALHDDWTETKRTRGQTENNKSEQTKWQTPTMNKYAALSNDEEEETELIFPPLSHAPPPKPTYERPARTKSKFITCNQKKKKHKGCQGSCCELPPDMVDPDTETEGETETDEIESEQEEETNNGTRNIWVELFNRKLPNRNLLYMTETAQDGIGKATDNSGWRDQNARQDKQEEQRGNPGGELSTTAERNLSFLESNDAEALAVNGQQVE